MNDVTCRTCLGVAVVGETRLLAGQRRRLRNLGTPEASIARARRVAWGGVQRTASRLTSSTDRANGGGPEHRKVGGTSAAGVPHTSQGAPVLTSQRLVLVFGERVIERVREEKRIYKLNEKITHMAHTARQSGSKLLAKRRRKGEMR